MTKTQSEGIYDARTLGGGKMLTLGLQHMFAMFGATVLVPVITGLSMSATLLFAGLGTLIFHLCTKLKVPAFLGSSFAFLGGYATVVQMGMAGGLTQAQALPYACIGVFCAGLIYFILAGLFAAFGAKKVMRFFPPIVTGPIIIAIGLILSGSAINNCNNNWWIALLAIVIIIVCNIWGKGMIKIIPILLGVLGSYIVAACFGLCDFSPVKEAAWVGLPVKWENTAISVFANPNWGLVLAAIIAIIPISLATMMEHIGDMCAISSTTGVNYLEDNNMLVCGEFVDKPDFQSYNRVVIPEEEAYAANCIWVNDTVIVPEGYPTVLKAVQDLGYKTLVVDTSEYRKLDGGLSCLSLRF